MARGERRSSVISSSMNRCRSSWPANGSAIACAVGPFMRRATRAISFIVFFSGLSHGDHRHARTDLLEERRSHACILSGVLDFPSVDAGRGWLIFGVAVIVAACGTSAQGDAARSTPVDTARDRATID